MPQKKNPDVLELVRGRAARVVGSLTALLVLVKGLPLAYNRDLQEDKEPLFDAVAQVALALTALGGLLSTAQFHTDRMQEAADSPALAAIDLAEFLVADGMPFREAHVLVGGLVRDSIERGVPLSDLVEAHPQLGGEAAALLEPGVPVTRRTTPGGAGPKPVAEQLSRFRSHLEVEEERIGRLRHHG
jgi:argininosuccinate lyase